MTKTFGIIGTTALLIAGACLVNAEDQTADREEKQGASVSVEEYRRAAAEIRTAVENGDVSSEDAETRLIEMRKLISREPAAGNRRGVSVEEYRRAEAEISRMVADGEVSKEDAERRLGGMRRAMQSGERGTGVKGVKARFISEEEYNPVSAELRKQAAEGKISREEAARKVSAMQQANTMAHVENSVKEGKMTRAEADAFYKRLGYQ